MKLEGFVWLGISPPLRACAASLDAITTSSLAVYASGVAISGGMATEIVRLIGEPVLVYMYASAFYV